MNIRYDYFSISSLMINMVKKLFLIWLWSILFTGISFSYDITNFDQPHIQKTVKKIDELSQGKDYQWWKSLDTLLTFLQRKNADYERLVAILDEVRERVDIEEKKRIPEKKESKKENKWISEWEEKDADENKEKENESESDIGNADENEEESEKENDMISEWEEADVSDEVEEEYTWKIDAHKVEREWIWWVNDIRNDAGLSSLKREKVLTNSATSRSVDLMKKWVADHKRFSNSAYYDYNQITAWFAQHGAVFKNVGWTTHTENIWRARYSCNSWDCTQVAIESMRRIYNYFAAESSYNGVHWRTMMHPKFEIVGVWFTIDETQRKIYGVMHYGTELLE